MPKQKIPSRKISIDLPMHLWNRYEEMGREYGMKIKEFVLGAFKAVDFLDKLMAETFDEVQIREISGLIRERLEKYEMLYCGKSRSRNLNKSNAIYFNKENDIKKNPDLAIRTHKINKKFQEQEDYSLALMNLRKNNKNPQRREREIFIDI